jgi:hypothetical protein
MATVSLDLAVHLFYGLGHDPAVGKRPSPYYTQFESYAGAKRFMEENRLSLDDYVELLRRTWTARFEKVAGKGGYLAIIPNADFPSDRVTPTGYAVRHRQERELIAMAREIFDGRMVVHPDPDGAARRMASRLKLDHKRVYGVEGTAYGEMAPRCVFGNGTAFVTNLQSYLPDTQVSFIIDSRYCADKAEGKREFLERYPDISERAKFR